MVIIDDVSTTVDNLKKLLGFESDIEVVGTALDAQAAVTEVRRLTPDVVLMDVNIAAKDGLEATQVVASLPATTPVILMSVQEDRDFLRRAMLAGAREFLIKPFSGDELVAAVRRVSHLERLKVVPAIPASSTGVALPALPAVRAAADAVRIPAESGAPEPAGGARTALSKRGNGKIFLVFSGKGGTGKSMLAVNLAATLAREGGSRTALVDLDLQFGDLGVLLGLDSSRNIYQVVEAFPHVDSDFVEALMPEAPGGFRVLLGPQSPEFADLVTGEQARTILEILQGAFDYIVVDTSSHLDEVTLEAIERAGQVVVLIDLSLPSVKEAKLALRVFARLGIPSTRIHIVVNRFDTSLGVTTAQVEATLDKKIVARIPNDPRLMLKSIQRAEPVAILFPTSEIAMSIQNLAGELKIPAGSKELAAFRSGSRRKGSFWGRTPAGKAN